MVFLLCLWGWVWAWCVGSSYYLKVYIKIPVLSLFTPGLWATVVLCGKAAPLAFSQWACSVGFYKADSVSKCQGELSSPDNSGNTLTLMKMCKWDSKRRWGRGGPFQKNLWHLSSGSLPHLTRHRKTARCKVFQRDTSHKGHRCKSQLWEEKGFLGLCFRSPLLSPPWSNAAFMSKQLLKWIMLLAYVLFRVPKWPNISAEAGPRSSQVCLIFFPESNQGALGPSLWRGPLWTKMDKFTGPCWPKIDWPSWTI